MPNWITSGIGAGRIGSVWCSLMHDSAMWPIHGRYQCRKCGREYLVPWRERKCAEPAREQHASIVGAGPSTGSTATLAPPRVPLTRRQIRTAPGRYEATPSSLPVGGRGASDASAAYGISQPLAPVVPINKAARPPREVGPPQFLKQLLVTGHNAESRD